MNIYFLRHGLAEDDAGSDFARQLTPEGREKCRLAGLGLATLGINFTHVWTSPLVRAMQTAQAVLPRRQAEVKEVLAGEPVERLIQVLASLPDDAEVLLIGHEPQFSLAVERLLGISGEVGLVEVKKASLVQVEVDLRRWPRQPAVLKLLLSPKVLRLLAPEA